MDKLRHRTDADGSSSSTNLLQTLLKVENECGRTAFLIACSKADHALVELLVDSEAELQAVDHSGNTATILLASSSPEMDEIVPSIELSPTIFKVCR